MKKKMDTKYVFISLSNLQINKVIGQHLHVCFEINIAMKKGGHINKCSMNEFLKLKMV